MATKSAAGSKSAKKGAAPEGAKVEPPKAGAKVNALQQPLKPSAELAAVVGEGPLPRGEVVSKVWEYIKAKNLQNPQDKREILADDLLKKVFGKDKVTMFEMNKHLAAHLK
jgi:chromatin remodeling complex protein RSC6